jgi:hypothetical protein
MKEKLIFERKEDYKGYNVKAWYLKEPNDGLALIEIFKDGNLLRGFKFPAYKIYNIAAHFEDIVESEIEQNTKGYEEAAWDGISGATKFIPDNSRKV